MEPIFIALKPPTAGQYLRARRTVMSNLFDDSALVLFRAVITRGSGVYCINLEQYGLALGSPGFEWHVPYLHWGVAPHQHRWTLRGARRTALKMVREAEATWSSRPGS